MASDAPHRGHEPRLGVMWGASLLIGLQAVVMIVMIALIRRFRARRLTAERRRLAAERRRKVSERRARVHEARLALIGMGLRNVLEGTTPAKMIANRDRWPDSYLDWIAAGMDRGLPTQHRHAA